MKQGPLQPLQLPVVLHCPGPHLWYSKLPKTGTHTRETSMNGPLLLRGIKPVSDPHKSSLHFFMLLEVSAVRSDRKNHQPLLTANGAVVLHSSSGYSVGTWWVPQRSTFLLFTFFLSTKDKGNAVSRTWGFLKHTEESYACSSNPRFVSAAT